MSRPRFSFRPNLQNEEHRKAWDLLQSVTEGQRNTFIARAILENVRQDTLEKIPCAGFCGKNFDSPLFSRKPGRKIPSPRKCFIFWIPSHDSELFGYGYYKAIMKLVKGAQTMIRYDPLWKTMAKKKATTYTLRGDLRHEPCNSAKTPV